MFLGTKNPQTILSTEDRFNKKGSIKYFSNMRRVLGCSEVQLPKLSCVPCGSQVCCLPKARRSAFHALVAHCDCGIPAVSQPSRKGSGETGISCLSDSALVASILLVRLNLWGAILTEMTFQKSSNHWI